MIIKILITETCTLDEGGEDHANTVIPYVFPALLDISDLAGSQFSLVISQIFSLPILKANCIKIYSRSKYKKMHRNCVSNNILLEVLRNSSDNSADCVLPSGLGFTVHTTTDFIFKDFGNNHTKFLESEL